MFKLGSISVGGIILIIIVLAIQGYYYCQNDNALTQNIKSLDFNKDGTVSRWELKHYLEMLESEKKKKSTTWTNIKKQIIGGMFRGFLMGIILSDLEGGIALGIVLGSINPVLHTAEKTIYN